ALLLAGCGSSPTQPKSSGTALPGNNTPQSTILRLLAAYQGKKLPEFRGLFTGDYRYEFSNSTDPTLVTKYASGWFAADESASAQHLFKGGNNSDGIYQQAASSIKIVFSPTAPGDDPDRDPATYKVLPTQVDGQIDVPNGAVTDTYVLNANRNRF